MLVCPRCGTQNAPATTACALCGFSLIGPVTTPQVPPSSLANELGRAPLAKPQDDLATTLAQRPGSSIDAATPPAAGPRPGAADLSRTLLGQPVVPPPPSTAPTVKAEARSSSPDIDATPVPGAAKRKLDLSRTMLGPGPTQLSQAPPAAAAPTPPPAADAPTPVPAQASGKLPSLNQTVLGQPIPAVAKDARVRFGQTLLGSGPAAAVEAAAREGAERERPATMLGIAPARAELASDHGGSVKPEAADFGRTARVPPVTQALLNRTSLGLAPPPAEPRAEGARTSSTPPPPPEPPPLTQTVVLPREAPNATPARTILGVARPGIAPLNPGLSKPAPARAAAERFPSAPPAPTEPISSSPMSPSPRHRSGMIAALALGGAVAVLAMGAAFFFWSRGPGPIEARLALDREGAELVELQCSRCEDGQIARLGGASGTFHSGSTTLKVPGGLKVGDNSLELALETPGGRTQRVTLSVPLEYRVKSSLEGLDHTPPELRLKIEAVPGSRVVVDKQPLALAANGLAEFALDVSKELTGLDPSVKRLERRIPYTITSPGGAQSSGEANFQLGIAPLTIDAPGESITIETTTFVLAGATGKGGQVSVGGRALQVDADGHFAQDMAVSSLGETVVTVRASGPNQAPRLYGFRVRRVESLAAEAKGLRGSATGSYATLSADIEKKKGWPVALDGTVADLGNAAHSTVLLLDTKSGCPRGPCLTRVVHGAKLDLRVGSPASVFGRLRGPVEGPRSGTTIPEVFADFVLPGGR